MHSVRKIGQLIRQDPVRFWACVSAFIFIVPFGYLFGSILHISKVVRPWFATSVCVAIVLIMNWCIPIFWAWVKSSIDVRWFFLHYAADRTVPVSHVEAMISAGDYVSATEEIETLLAKHGVDPTVCRVAMDFHLGRFGSPEIAERLLRRMRNEDAAGFELVATQRLIDLYMRDSETHGKALTELRRLTVRFPGSREADGARRAIDELQRVRSGAESAA